jgi:type IV pilus assembly protein PilN
MINDINLIPKSNKKASRATILINTAVYLCFAIVIAFLGYYIPVLHRSQIENQIAQKEYDLQQYADTETTFNDLTKTIHEIQNKITYFDSLKSSLKMSQIFNDLEKNIPRDVIITSLSLNEGTLAVNGVSPSYKEIAQYMVKIRGLDYVNGVSLSNADMEEESAKEAFDFTLNANLNMPELVLNTEEDPATEPAADTNDSSNNEGEALENETN